MAARGIAGGECALATSRMAHEHAAVRRGVLSPFLWNSRLGVLFVTSEALFCSAIHFAKACGKSVTVGTIKWRRSRNSANAILRAGCVNQCQAQMRLCQLVAVSISAKV